MTKQTLDLYLDPILQAHFEKVKGEWQDDDPIYCTMSEVQFTVQHDHIPCSSCKWLPKPIDIENPSRGCWFMLTKQNKSDKLFLNELVLSDNPTLVILKKLANQLEVVIK
jgi:hypothetical protein